MTNLALNRITVFQQNGEPEFIFTPHFEGDTPESVSKQLSEKLLSIGERFALFGSVDVNSELPLFNIIFQKVDKTDNAPSKEEVEVVLTAVLKVKFFLPRKCSGTSTTWDGKTTTLFIEFVDLAEQKLCLELLRSSSTKEEHLNPLLKRK
ncbi:MAG: hypothetical protein HY973_03605 [Candidatus Kerfeldbacteria bacterium]|nr:hypothetical protein [Candidatus Kerfeldbacteria bacterium]